jgi:hypothetical protein
LELEHLFKRGIRADNAQFSILHLCVFIVVLALGVCPEAERGVAW